MSDYTQIEPNDSYFTKIWKPFLFSVPAFILGVVCASFLTRSVSQKLPSSIISLDMKKNYIYEVREVKVEPNVSLSTLAQSLVKDSAEIRTGCFQDEFGNNCCTFAQGTMQCAAPHEPTSYPGSSGSQPPAQNPPRAETPRPSAPAPGTVTACNNFITQCTFLIFGCTNFCVA